MERINRIMAHPLYQRNQRRIEELEQDRIFCRHGIPHALDVARILYILVLEQELPFLKDVVYAAALLHDLGRCAQYEQNVPHYKAGTELAEDILRDCGYKEQEIQMISEAILTHHVRQNGKEEKFSSLLRMADKLSRNCFDCEAWKECYWEQEKRNHTISY